MELILNFAIWIGAALFSLYNVYHFGRNVDKSELFSNDFIKGWSVIGRSKDVSDFEWITWKVIAIYILPWIIVHIIISEYLRNNTIYLKIWYFFLPNIFILYNLGYFIFCFMFVQPLVYYILTKCNFKIKYIWVCSSIFLIIFNMIKYKYADDNDYFLNLFKINDDEFYMVSVGNFWIQLRCISYCLEISKINKVKDNKNIQYCSILDMFSYCYYLPLLFLGPIILYNDFQCSFQTKPILPYKLRLYHFCINLCRYIWWYIFLEVLLHFIYFNALQYNIQVVKIMPDWCLYGGGLWMGLYFYIKYLVNYGIAGSLAALDNITPETPPLCIARVHLYSQMWKYFDVGLHKFLIRYIYKPVMDMLLQYKINYLLMKSIASLMCFVFVLFWHGANYFIFIWTALNYFGIVIENTGYSIGHNHFYRKFEKDYIEAIISKERFYAVLSAPILVVSAISNFYFFGGSEIGDIYVKRVLEQSFVNFIGMFVCIYSCCRVSQYLNNVRARKILS